MVQRQGRLLSMVLKDIVVIFLAALGYSQHAKPYCQNQPHSLPPESNVLKAYPCDAGAASRALYIIQNVFGVYHDMLRLGPNDRWASFQLIVVWLSLGVRLTLPAKWSTLLRTSVLSQLHRLIPLSYLLVASYYGVPPSSSGRWYLLTHPVLDFLANSVYPVHPVSECVFCATSILLTIAIWCRYGQLATLGVGSPSNVMLAGGAAIARGTDNTCIAGMSSGAAALAAAASPPGTVCGVVSAITGTGEGVVNSGGTNMSPYHLGSWLPFHLLMSLAALTATWLLEWWRGPPDELVTTGWNMSSWPRRTNKRLSRSKELVGCCEDIGVAAAAAARSCGGGTMAKADAAVAIARPNRHHTVIKGSCCNGGGAREPMDGSSSGHGPCSNGELIANQAEPKSTDAKDVGQLRPSSSDDIAGLPEALLKLIAPPSIEAVSCVPVGADAAQGSRGYGSDGSNDDVECRNHNQADLSRNMANASRAHGAGAADRGYDSSGVDATDAAAEAETEARGASDVHVLRWTTGCPVQDALGSPSSLGPALWRDSEVLAEGFMLGGPDAGDQESEDAGRAAGLRSNGSSRVDVARHDQQVRSATLPTLPPPPALAMSGGGVDGATEGPAVTPWPPPLMTPRGGGGDDGVWVMDGARAAAAADGPEIPASEPFPAAGHGIEADVVVAAASAVVQRDNSIDDDIPVRDHHRAYRLLRSISSQVSQSPPQHNFYTHSHSHLSQQDMHMHGRLESQSHLQLQFQGNGQVADQLMDDRTVPQLPPQAQQRQDTSQLTALLRRHPSQDVGPLSSPDESFSAAAVMAAVQQARRPVYVPRVRLVTTHIKVHGAQPDQLQSGYTQRLENVVSAVGQRLIGVYVRAGCIELVLDSADWGDGKSSDAGDISSEMAPQSGGRESGPLPAPLQPRPQPYPPYWSAPNTPSRLQRAQQQQQALLGQQQMPTHDAAQSQPRGGAATQPHVSCPQAAQDAAAVVSPSSVGSHVSAACLGLAPIPGFVQRGGTAAIAGQGQGQWYGYGQGGGGGSGITATGGNSGNGTDLDLGAVIRALRLHRTEGSADCANDLDSTNDMDLEFGDRADNITSELTSGGMEASSKESSVGSGGRRGGGGGGADAFSPMALGLTATGGVVPTNTRLLQQLQQQVLLQQLQHHQRFQDAGAVMPATPPPPQAPSVVASMAGPISRQALVLGGPRDPMAPGIVSLSPRVFVTVPSASSVVGGARGVEAVLRFAAVVRQVSTIPLGAVPSNVAGAAAAGLDPEFTIRARGEYLPLRAVRVVPATVAARVSLVSEPTWTGTAPRGGGGSAVSVPMGGIGGGMLGGEDDLLPEMMLGPGQGLQDTRRDIDTGYYSEDGRPAPAAWMWHESFILELMELPQCPGLLLVDLRGDEPALGRAPRRAVPLVAMTDASAAAELQAAVECWEGTQSELDDLLLDLGTWLHHMSQPAPQAAAGTVSMLDQRLVALGRHLLSYAEICGWRATAAALQGDLAKHGISRVDTNGSESGSTILPSVQLQPQLPAGPVLLATAAASVPAVADVASVALEPRPQPPHPRRIAEASARRTARSAGGAIRRAWDGLLPLQVLTWLRNGGRGVAFVEWLRPGATPEEREGFKAFVRAYGSQQIWLITLLDVISLAALLFRGRHVHLLAPSNVVTLIACCVGVFTAAARVVLPYNQWLRLAEVTKVPRHVCYCVTKGLIGIAGFPAPPGITSYELGLPVFIFEGVIVPWSCLLSVPTAVAVAAAKVPFYMALWHRLALMALKDSEVAALETTGCRVTATAARGVSNADALCPYTPGLGFTGYGEGAAMLAMLSYLSPFRRIVRALSIFCIFVFVTAACHIQMLSAYHRLKRRRAVVELADSAKPGTAASLSAMTLSAGGARGGGRGDRGKGKGTLVATPWLRKLGKCE
ncbi:hypothetical protein VaNZ11_002197 [Volvox africanus]|uniref:Uncharacterized protein n=1 Tax=Volvox africanus TaxID=51714 RepID=A0ABQ5RS21_9CHLO|nr:hypothetical protein VaNZ11_002197 [Volvox africanus]